MQPDPEHQQDDADLGELQRQVLVGDKAGRGRADRDAGEQIPDQRRDAQPVGDRAEDEGEADAEDDRRDQRGRVVLHDAGSILRYVERSPLRSPPGGGRPEVNRKNGAEAWYIRSGTETHLNLHRP